MTLNEFLQRAGQLIGLAEKGVTTSPDQAARITDLEKQVSDSKARETQSATRITSLEADLSTSKQFSIDIAAQLESQRGKISTLETELTGAKQAVTEFDVKVEKAASAKAAQITGAQGQSPIVDPPKTKSATASPNEPKGLNRVIAAFEKQINQKP